MAILNLVVAPNALLQQKSIDVIQITPEITKLCNDMLETMYHHHGIGLSAVQVGVLKRLIVVDVLWPALKKPSENPYIMINPTFKSVNEVLNNYNEGCLSFPNESVGITRPKEISVSFLDINGNTQEIIADGLLATCIQHEIDHLNGITISSYVSPLKKTMMINRTRKIKRIMENVI